MDLLEMLFGQGTPTDYLMGNGLNTAMRNAAASTPSGAPGGGKSAGGGGKKSGGWQSALPASGGKGGMAPSPSFPTFVKGAFDVGYPMAIAPFEANLLPRYGTPATSGAQKQAEDIEAALKAAQDEHGRMASLAEEKAQIENAMLRSKANEGPPRGGSIGGLAEGIARNQAATQNMFKGKSAYQRAEGEKDFGTELMHDRLMAEMKMKLLQKMLGGGVGGSFGGGPLTTTEETHGQQIVNNAGSWEPRDVVTTSQKTEPINPLDLVRVLFGGGLF